MVQVMMLGALFAGSPVSAADIRSSSAWPTSVPSLPLEQRVAPAPAALIHYLHADNRRHGIRDVPRSTRPHPELAKYIREAIATMPAVVHDLIRHKLISVYTVRGLGSTAWAEHISGPQQKWDRAIVVLDVQAVDKRGNTWFSWRESTAFKPTPGFALRAHITDDAQNGRVDAIRYILLHEFAHVASIGSDYLPDWNVESLPPEQTCDYAFVCLSWNRYGKDEESRYDGDFPDRSRIAYYRPTKSRLDADRAEPIYNRLATTDFVSAYAATSSHEDFAEAFANYVHTHLLGLPYRVDILRDGMVAAGMGPCWNEPRCGKKREFLESLLGVGNGG